MITPDYIRFMAVYNHWQNDNLVAAADTLSDEQRRADRGAFFRSIHETFNHLLWADQIWMSRLAGTPGSRVGTIPESVSQIGAWEEFKAERKAFDTVMIDWARGASEADATGDLSWYSGAVGRKVTKPRAMLFMQLFNHGTHHRGQIHAMLTAAGARPSDTDIPFMPADYLALTGIS